MENTLLTTVVTPTLTQLFQTGNLPAALARLPATVLLHPGVMYLAFSLAAAALTRAISSAQVQKKREEQVNNVVDNRANHGLVKEEKTSDDILVNIALLVRFCRNLQEEARNGTLLSRDDLMDKITQLRVDSAACQIVAGTRAVSKQVTWHVVKTTRAPEPIIILDSDDEEDQEAAVLPSVLRKPEVLKFQASPLPNRTRSGVVNLGIKLSNSKESPPPWELGEEEEEVEEEDLTLYCKLKAVGARPGKPLGKEDFIFTAKAPEPKVNLDLLLDQFEDCPKSSCVPLSPTAICGGIDNAEKKLRELSLQLPSDEKWRTWSNFLYPHCVTLLSRSSVGEDPMHNLVLDHLRVGSPHLILVHWNTMHPEEFYEELPQLLEAWNFKLSGLLLAFFQDTFSSQMPTEQEEEERYLQNLYQEVWEGHDPDAKSHDILVYAFAMRCIPDGVPYVARSPHELQEVVAPFFTQYWDEFLDKLLHPFYGEVLVACDHLASFVPHETWEPRNICFQLLLHAMYPLVRSSVMHSFLRSVIAVLQ